MANENAAEDVKYERIEVAPAGDDDETDEGTETQPDSSQAEADEEGAEATEEAPESEGTEEAELEGEADAEPESTTETAASNTKDEKYGDVKPVPGESKRELALRIEIARLRGDLRKDRAGEIITPPPVAARPELSAEKKAILEKIKPEDMKAFRDVLEIAADEMGFVKKGELTATRYQEQASDTLDTFLEKHPEYLPQNDQGNVLWNRFKEEFALYKPAANAKELSKLLAKVHKEVFGIRPAAALDKKAAARKNVQVASHAGSSRPAPSREGIRRSATPAPTGLRTDMLKGFSDDEIAELGA